MEEPCLVVDESSMAVCLDIEHRELEAMAFLLRRLSGLAGLQELPLDLGFLNELDFLIQKVLQQPELKFLHVGFGIEEPHIPPAQFFACCPCSAWGRILRSLDRHFHASC